MLKRHCCAAEAQAHLAAPGEVGRRPSMHLIGVDAALIEDVCLRCPQGAHGHRRRLLYGRQAAPAAPHACALCPAVQQRRGRPMVMTICFAHLPAWLTST